MNYVLTIREGPETGKRFSIESGRAYTVGRGVSCEIMLHDREISRVHCIINASENPVMISDLESLNGTLVDGQRILTKILSGGESIVVGNTKLEFSTEHGDGQVQAQPAAAAVEPAPVAPAEREASAPEPPAEPMPSSRCLIWQTPTRSRSQRYRSQWSRLKRYRWSRLRWSRLRRPPSGSRLSRSNRRRKRLLRPMRLSRQAGADPRVRPSWSL